MNGLWLIVIVYVAIVLLGRSQQQKRRAQGGGARRTGLDDLQRMLQGTMPPSEEEQRLEERLQLRPPVQVTVTPAAEAPEPVVDYDVEAIKLAEQRRRAAETAAFLPPGAAPKAGPTVTLRALPATAVASRIESRIASRVVAPPAAADATGAAAATPGAGTVPPAAARLARYADGSLRGAFVLSEILGRPRGDA